jgi:ABC-type uncharacterized transport system substrate-binding protein
MNLESYGTTPENLTMAKKDLAVLRDLFHTLNDAGISFSSLNSSIALIEEYIENADTENITAKAIKISRTRTAQPVSQQMWNKSNILFARHVV